MKAKTDLRAGQVPGACHMKVNRFGMCKKILCPYPPFKFSCNRRDLVRPRRIFYGAGAEDEEEKNLG